jgi:tetratricopeptide (TPR) repeat protein
MTWEIDQSDKFHLEAAEGWLGLGDWREAQKEFEQVSPGLYQSPPCLAVCWQIQAAAREWEKALETASALIAKVPDHPIGWINRSFSLHELKRTEEARDGLLRVADRFPGNSTIRYNVACYECQLGRVQQARVWFQHATRLGDADQIRKAALEDTDLRPLWDEIRQMGEAS